MHKLRMISSLLILKKATNVFLTYIIPPINKDDHFLNVVCSTPKIQLFNRFQMTQSKNGWKC